MMEIMAIGVGMMMTALALGVAGLALEAILFVLGRAIQSPFCAISFEPVDELAAVHLS